MPHRPAQIEELTAMARNPFELHPHRQFWNVPEPPYSAAKQRRSSVLQKSFRQNYLLQAVWRCFLCIPLLCRESSAVKGELLDHQAGTVRQGWYVRRCERFGSGKYICMSGLSPNEHKAARLKRVRHGRCGASIATSMKDGAT